MPKTDPTHRPLYSIAHEIKRLWKPVNYAAIPYLEVMGRMVYVTDNYGADDGKGIVLRFLGNAKTWRGDDARRIKAELRSML